MPKLTVKDEVRSVLERFPEAREDNRYLMVRVWQEFHGFPKEPWVEEMIESLPQTETIRRSGCQIKNEEGQRTPKVFI